VTSDIDNYTSSPWRCDLALINGPQLIFPEQHTASPSLFDHRHNSTDARETINSTCAKVQDLVAGKQMLVSFSGKSTSALLRDRVVGSVQHHHLFLDAVHQTPELLLHGGTGHGLYTPNSTNTDDFIKTVCQDWCR